MKKGQSFDNTEVKEGITIEISVSSEGGKSHLPPSLLDHAEKTSYEVYPPYLWSWVSLPNRVIVTDGIVLFQRIYGRESLSINGLSGNYFHEIYLYIKKFAYLFTYAPPCFKEKDLLWLIRI